MQCSSGGYDEIAGRSNGQSEKPPAMVGFRWCKGSIFYPSVTLLDLTLPLYLFVFSTAWCSCLFEAGTPVSL